MVGEELVMMMDGRICIPRFAAHPVFARGAEGPAKYVEVNLSVVSHVSLTVYSGHLDLVAESISSLTERAATERSRVRSIAVMRISIGIHCTLIDIWLKLAIFWSSHGLRGAFRPSQESPQASPPV